jgi:hypothetical protein
MDTRVLPSQASSDMRSLGAISAPAAAPLFPAEPGGTESALDNGAARRQSLRGCWWKPYVLQAPDAYHAAWRRGEIEARRSRSPPRRRFCAMP